MVLLAMTWVVPEVDDQPSGRPPGQLCHSLWQNLSHIISADKFGPETKFAFQDFLALPEKTDSWRAAQRLCALFYKCFQAWH